MSFGAFLNRNIAAARLAVLSHLEYRVDFFVDTILQPVMSTGIELALWSTILTVGGLTQLNGFSRASYLSYILWAIFVGRTTANWAYEMEMDDEIESGQVNVILLRPISFYEYYLSQFVGYKFSTLLVSFGCPLLVTAFFPTTVIWSRFPTMLALIFFYLFFVHTLSFCVACLGFFITRVKGITGLKNMALWVLTGESFPLDLIPEPYKGWVLHLPFAGGVYYPVAYLTGRIGAAELRQAFVSVGGGLLIMIVVAAVMWRRGLREYSGTGA
jgi:ABC-2 type transport system permease protein